MDADARFWCRHLARRFLNQTWGGGTAQAGPESRWAPIGGPMGYPDLWADEDCGAGTR